MMKIWKGLKVLDQNEWKKYLIEEQIEKPAAGEKLSQSWKSVGS